MAVIARDTFSGDNDADINGRTPDGGLDVSTAIGTWTFSNLTGSACCIDLVAGSGAAAQSGNFGVDSHYKLAGLGLTSDDVLVRVTGEFHGTSGWFGCLLNHQASAANNVATSYELLLFRNPGAYDLTIFANGTDNLGADDFEVLAQIQNFALADGPHTLEFSRQGDTLYAAVDGVTKLTYRLNLTTGADVFPTITGGDPGLCITNATASGQDVFVTLFEVETSAAAPAEPCTSATKQAVYAQDCFQGATTLGGILGRIPDGCEYDCVAQGTWYDVLMLFRTSPDEAYCAIGHQIGDNFSTLVHVNPTSFQQWNHEAVENVANLGNDYSVEVEGYFTGLFTGASNTYAWISCLARQQPSSPEDPGFTISFPTAGTQSWKVPNGISSLYVECWQGGAGGGGATGSPAAGGGGAGGTYVAKQIEVTPGETLTVIVGAGRAATFGAGQAGNFSAVRRGATDLVRADGAQGGGLASTNSSNGAGGAALTTGSIGDLIEPGTAGSAGNFTSGASGGQGGAGGNGGAGGGAPADNANGPDGTAPGGGSAGGKAITTTDRQGGASARGEVRINPNVGTGGHATESGWEFFLDNAGDDLASGAPHFIYFIHGAYTHVRIFEDFPLTAGERFRLRLCCSGNTFCLYINDQLIGTHTDDRWPTGIPGLCTMDATQGTIVRVTKWKVVSDEPGAPPCGGPTGSGGGHAGGGAGEVQPFLWPLGKGAWRPVNVPIDQASSKVRPFGKGVPRGSIPTGIYSRGAWRTLLPPSTGGEGDGDNEFNGNPGDTLEDPGCGSYPPSDPDIPVEPLDPIGDRLFYTYGADITGGPEVFETRGRGWGGNLTISMLTTGQAIGRRLFSSQGGYEQRKTNGRYDPSKMDDLIDEIISFGDRLKPFFDAGVYYAHMLIDDYRSAVRWGIEISPTEISRVGLRLKAGLPWMRTMVRDSPTYVKAAGDGGTNLPGIDVFLTQHVTRYGAIEGWIPDQIAQANAWGGKRILWAMNALNYHGIGEKATVSDVMSAGMLLATQTFGEGMGFWEGDDPRFYGQSGMPDALVAIRNAMANT